MIRRFLIAFLLIPQIQGQLVLDKKEISILGIRASFLNDDLISSTGDGSFLMAPEEDQCLDHLIDPPPHNRSYFEAHFQAIDNYFRSVSKGRFGIDLKNSLILPFEMDSSYELTGTIGSYYPYNDSLSQALGMAELFKESIELAHSLDQPKFNDFDVIVIFHAGIGQDFDLPFIDPTQTDIPSMYIDSEFLMDQINFPGVKLSDSLIVRSGIILPETQNHLLYSISSEIFAGVSNPCDYQFGLTGTFALLMGSAIGLPSLWNTETGESGAGVFALMDQGSNNGRGVIPSPPNPWTRIWAGWEKSKDFSSGDTVKLESRDLSIDQTAKIVISSNEYFLVENRNNWIRPSVDIDSIKWTINGSSYIEAMFDSSGLIIDNNTGVVIGASNYDLGLPGSGMLIWHIDEDRISEGLINQNLNFNKNIRAIDIEEADGAQDIGYPSAFLFTNPSSGLWSDMWFHGNDQFFIANSAFENRQISFGPDTYPNSNSNGGGKTFIEFNNFTPAGKTMSFYISNSFVANGFPKPSLNMEFLFDFNADKFDEIIGFSDSLWWSSSQNFSPSEISSHIDGEYLLGITNAKLTPQLVFIVNEEDKIKVTLFSFNTDKESFQTVWRSEYFDSLPTRIIGFANESKIALDYPSKKVFITADSLWEEKGSNIISANWQHVSSENLSGSVSHFRDEGLYVSTLQGESFSGFQGVNFQSLIAVELDGDNGIEILASDEKGVLYAMNENLTLLSGFPIDIGAEGPILVGQLYDTPSPEIVTKTNSGAIYIIDSEGYIQYKLASSKNDEVKMISVYNGKNALLTSSSLWLFEENNDQIQDYWPTAHGDIMNRRIFQKSDDLTIPNEKNLILFAKTYNYPNPVEKGMTTFRVTVGNVNKITINIYDTAGFFIDRLEIPQVQINGVNELIWDVRDLESGLYLANIEASFESKTENKIIKIAIIN
tara:strand:- start:18410 stop:21232 length:2823 start_codon:yes stop_codon:yes gene_type:complete